MILLHEKPGVINIFQMHMYLFLQTKMYASMFVPKAAGLQALKLPLDIITFLENPATTTNKQIMKFYSPPLYFFVPNIQGELKEWFADRFCHGHKLYLL